ncbi:MAG: nicotinate phosphoribosyltransferase [Myxococcota bacterium]
MTKNLIDGRKSALLTDQYQLTMAQAYVAEGMHAEKGTFSLFSRELPERRNFLLAAGLASALELLEELQFSVDDIDYLHSLGTFSDQFLEYLRTFEFQGDIWAPPEGTPVFPNEPWIEVEAPIPQAQIAETLILNQLNSPTILASKAARVVAAAQGRSVVDFGLRRMHGADGATNAARAYHIAGVTATSNVMAGKQFGVPVTGTMAHSYIQAHDDEMEAFRRFVSEFPETVLLVDTYDTLAGVDKVIELADELGDGFRVRGIRLDSGDLGDLATKSRAKLDEAGLEDVEIFASGGLDEDKIAAFVDEGRPIDGFGVGTRMGVSSDAPKLDCAYKLVEYAGEGRLKLATGKHTLPGKKQVFRQYEDGVARRDVIGRRGEELDGRPLMIEVMRQGERLDAGRTDIDLARERAANEIAKLPERIRRIEPADEPYEVKLSAELEAYLQEVKQRVKAQNA